MFNGLQMPKGHPTFKGTALVCGGAESVWEDISPFAPEVRGGGAHIMCVNDIGMHMPFDVKHWFSNSANDIHNWMQCRRRGYNTNIITHALAHVKRNHPVKWVWPWPGHGTSSLNAVYTCLAMGYGRVVLCGVPLDNRPHYFDPPWQKTTFAQQVPDRDGEMKWWSRANREVFEGRVTSRSGRTMELLGAP